MFYLRQVIWSLFCLFILLSFNVFVMKYIYINIG